MAKKSSKEEMERENDVEELKEETSEKRGDAALSKSNLRGNHKLRIVLIVILMAIVAALFIFWGKARIWLAIIFFTLLAALGLETFQKDWDLQKLIQTKSFEQSQVSRDSSGNILFDPDGNMTTDSTKGKEADKYNCDDFSTQPKAQTFFEKVGGTSHDLNRLDGDKDGEACESLPEK